MPDTPFAIPATPVDHGDPADWDELPDGFTAVIATELEDRGWIIDTYDGGNVVNVIAADGREASVGFTGGRVYAGICDGEYGECSRPVDILADVTDPEQIAGRADEVMREIGLKPGKPEAA